MVVKKTTNENPIFHLTMFPIPLSPVWNSVQYFMSYFVISKGNECFIYLCNLETSVYAVKGSCNVPKVRWTCTSCGRALQCCHHLLKICFVLCSKIDLGEKESLFRHFFLNTLYSLSLSECSVFLMLFILFSSPVAQTVFSVFTEMKEIDKPQIT